MCSSLPSRPLPTLGVPFSCHRMSSLCSQHSRKRSLCKWSPLPHFPLASPPTTARLLHPSPTETALLKARSAPFVVRYRRHASLSLSHQCFSLCSTTVYSLLTTSSPAFVPQRAPGWLLPSTAASQPSWGWIVSPGSSLPHSSPCVLSSKAWVFLESKHQACLPWLSGPLLGERRYLRVEF